LGSEVGPFLQDCLEQDFLQDFISTFLFTAVDLPWQSSSSDAFVLLQRRSVALEMPAQDINDSVITIGRIRMVILLVGDEIVAFQILLRTCENNGRKS
jgi:hypothetical protein